MNAWARARGQILFLVGLLIASGFVVWLDRKECVPVSDVEPAPVLISTPPAEARAAWSYFERNRDAKTGLVHANDRSGWTTVADVGHALKAAVAAHRLGLISGRELYDELALPLKTLATLDPRVAGMRFDPTTARAAGPAPGTTPQPLLSALELIAWSYPANSAAASAALERWRRHATNVPSAAAPPSDAAKNAALLVRAALARRGEDR